MHKRRGGIVDKLWITFDRSVSQGGRHRTQRRPGVGLRRFGDRRHSGPRHFCFRCRIPCCTTTNSALPPCLPPMHVASFRGPSAKADGHAGWHENSLRIRGNDVECGAFSGCCHGVQRGPHAHWGGRGGTDVCRVVRPKTVGTSHGPVSVWSLSSSLLLFS